ncbi:four-carbon acid sugar kinase family protein [Sinorhizobium fredii]|uniref:four-carbon acid sugar kinase family protein n=1 Tax=Rhizobium fredii TaxID=380 RepID=UPI0004AD610E|nr:four-carbon acid sugar kinase family protein [Sinorhizobium fredii]AWM27814.1 putative type III effector Hop protein [Sinorhizobium fredii CCBAU 25509]MCG5474691.1 four-carbon acid sugar kinase family protein [Sinorhizobium fredii]
MQTPLLSYYGDDLTGSTDVMEALASQGVETALFLKIPEARLLERFAHCRAFGLAGTSRSQTPDWMAQHLPAAFVWLKSLGAEIAHYKVCSTFDSSPTVGNIGKAVEIGREVFGKAPVPLVLGAPQIRRYTSFGNLFAAFRGETYRIDRHPVMSRHPVTPMDEADIRQHLSRQTSLKTGLVDIAQLASADANAATDFAFAEGNEIVLLDVAGAESQAAVGRQLWRKRSSGGQFACGSSGLEYALVREWRRLGLLGDAPAYAASGPVDRIAVVSGSVSPTTERQIRHALQSGFDGIGIDPVALAAAESGAALEDAMGRGLAALAAGRSVLLYTALGPSSDRGNAIGLEDGSRHRIGERLGLLLKELVKRAGLRRAVIAGGDTSSHALNQLSVDALTLRLPLPQSPGSPLCTAHGADPSIDGIEVALKGGQVGLDDYFSMIRDGRPAM